MPGCWSRRLGGPSVKPYQPAGLWKEICHAGHGLQSRARAPDLYRRSLYTFWKRTIAPPMMINFDAAGRESCVVRETRTNTPLQALNLMNDVTFLEAARFIGQRMMKEGGADAAARLRYGFRLRDRPHAIGAETADPARQLAATICDYFAARRRRPQRVPRSRANRRPMPRSIRASWPPTRRSPA